MITRKKRSTLDRDDFSSEPVGLIGVALRRACIRQQMATDTGSDQPARPLNNLVRGMRKGSTAPVGRHRRRLFVALMLWCLLLGVNSPGQAPDPGQDLRVAESLMSGADGVVDYPSAAMFLRRAASQGSFDAEGLLGKLYLRGEGVPGNLAKANQRIQASAAGGSAIGQTYLAKMLMNGWYLKRDPVRARRLLEKVYNRYPPALTLLGRLYLTGAGGEEDALRALDLFTRASEAGDADGEFRLEEMYLLGLGVQQDSERAAIWLEKAAAKDDPNAQFRLGKMYAQGTGVDRDPRRALRLFVAAARHRYVPAEMVLGERDTFLRSPRFWPRAAYWFSLAAKGGSRRGGVQFNWLWQRMSAPQRRAEERLETAAGIPSW